MTEDMIPISDVFDEAMKRNYIARSPEMTDHDKRLFQNDPIVYQLAKNMTQAMMEFGIKKVAAAFRAALVMCRREEIKNGKSVL